MKIIDINNKEREALSVKRITHQIPDAVKGGIATTKEYAEVVIIGKTGRKWIEWYTLEEFVAINPNVVVENANRV